MRRETKRRKPASGGALVLLRLVARAIRRQILTNDALLELVQGEGQEEEALKALASYMPHSKSQSLKTLLMAFLRELAEGRRDPAVILGQKPRRGRKSNAPERAAVVEAYWTIRRELPKSKKPHIDACRILWKQYPHWTKYSADTLRQMQKAAGPEARLPPTPPVTAEDFDILG